MGPLAYNELDRFGEIRCVHAYRCTLIYTRYRNSIGELAKPHTAYFDVMIRARDSEIEYVIPFDVGAWHERGEVTTFESLIAYYIYMCISVR